jgi:hypothetical protein
MRWGDRIRTYGCLDQNQVPYHLATPHRVGKQKSYHSCIYRLWSARRSVNFVTKSPAGAYLRALSGTQVAGLFHQRAGEV